MFSLELTDAVTFEAEWLIDRIMKFGSVWLASLARTSATSVSHTNDTQIPAARGMRDTDLRLRDLFDETYEDVSDTARTSSPEDNPHVIEGVTVSRRQRPDPR